MASTPKPSKSDFSPSQFGVDEEIYMRNEEGKISDERIIVNSSNISPARSSVADRINNGGGDGNRNGSRNDKDSAASMVNAATRAAATLSLLELPLRIRL